MISSSNVSLYVKIETEKKTTLSRHVCLIANNNICSPINYRKNDQLSITRNYKLHGVKSVQCVTRLQRPAVDVKYCWLKLNCMLDAQQSTA